MAKSRHGQQTCLYEDKKLDAISSVAHGVGWGGESGAEAGEVYLRLANTQSSANEPHTKASALFDPGIF